MKKVVISFIKEYRLPSLRPPCDPIDDVIIMKILFLHNLGRSFHIWGEIEAVFNISTFSKWPPFWARDKLFYRKLYRELNIPERQPWAFPTFWAFDRRYSSNIEGDISISKFDQFCYLVTSSMTSWIYIDIIVVISSWYLCTGSIMMISLLVFKLLWKTLLFHL